MSSGNLSKVETAELLHSAAIRVLRMVRTEDAQAGIGPAQLSALSVLVFGGAKTVSELATLEQVRPPTMSRIVEGLAQKKLVQRVDDEADRRTVRVRATAKGEKLMQAGKARRVRALAERFEALSPGDVKTLFAAAQLMLRL
ncbi:MAG TPA: MarR family transcriptional regulator [Candidatus Acidoferrum sp.]|jgi:DNA-binding MarR family transcriptional regulator|nr:MarR family transcriptional regulator [Candidatus Acidoferrum sp.]